MKSKSDLPEWEKNMDMCGNCEYWDTDICPYREDTHSRNYCGGFKKKEPESEAFKTLTSLYMLGALITGAKKDDMEAQNEKTP